MRRHEWFGGNVSKGILITSQKPRGLHVPGPVMKSSPGCQLIGGYHLRRRDDILTNNSERTPIVIGLRIQTVLTASGGDPVSISEKGLLAGSPVAGQCALMAANRTADAESQFTQRLYARFQERLRKKAASEILALVTDFLVIARGVCRAVEDAYGITQRRTEEGVVDLHPNIVIGCKLSGEPVFDKEQFGSGLQPPQPHRRLEFPGLDLELRPQPRIHIG